MALDDQRQKLMKPYYQQTTEQVLASFSVDLQTGLDESVVQTLQEKYGENILVEKSKRSPFWLFLQQFKSFIIYILLFAIVLSWLQYEYVDALIISIILFTNALVGFIQEYRAEKAIDALKKLAGLSVTVLRGGEKKTLETRELVPGDIIYLEEGSKIPADARLLSCTLFRVSEASLTGESVSVDKQAAVLAQTDNLADQKNMVFSGTLVAKGRAVAVVTGTGMATEIGKIATLLSEVEVELTPLQKKLDVLGRRIGVATLLICFAILSVGIAADNLFDLLLAGNWTGFLLGANSWLLLAVVLAVAAVPEGLPAIVTVSLSVGVHNMARRNVLIRRLPSVETLGETTVICSDKTGTLTKNQMTVSAVFTSRRIFDVGGEGYSTTGVISVNGAAAKLSDQELLLFRAGCLCNDANLQASGNITGDPTEASLLVSAAKAGLSYTQEQEANPRVGELPFDSTRKMMSTLHRQADGFCQFTKGAPEQVLRVCDSVLVDGQVLPLSDELCSEILAQNDAFTGNALRVLAFAFANKADKTLVEKQLVFIGLQAMIDPPHEEVPAAIKTAQLAGIRIVMITGDNRLTAQSIANSIGIPGEAMEGAEFARLSEPEQFAALQTTAIFARVEPGHKMLIIDLLQQRGEVVAMTGDGVNDAPALRKADIGIAMGIAGSDVAKESSDMILLNDNYAGIVYAIEEGRGIFANIRKFVNYLLSSNLGEVSVIFFALILFGVDQLPMTAVMILWLNLVTDGLPALALSVDPNQQALMNRPPEKTSAGILNKAIAINIVAVSVLITVAVLAVFYWSRGAGAGLAYQQTMAFTLIVVLELVRLQTIRQEHRLGMFSNKYLVWAVLVSIGLQLLVIYSPLAVFFGTVALAVSDWMVIILVAAMVWLCNRLVQSLLHRGDRVVV